MEKNKNRTDLLAAGRKKLQQFRQKKDNKGSNSRSSGKAGKSGRDTTVGTVPEAGVTEQHAADGERSIHNSEDAIALSESGSRVDSVASDTTAATDELSAKPGSPEIASFAGAAEISLEGSGVDEVLLNQPVDDGHDVVSRLSHEDRSSSLIIVDTKYDVPGASDPTILPEDLMDSSECLPIDSSSELGRPHGEDQVTDVGAMQEADSSTENQIDKDRVPQLEGCGTLSSNEFSKTDGDNKIADPRHAPAEEETHVAKQLSKTDDASLTGSTTSDAEEVQEMHDDSLVTASLPESGLVSTVSSVVICPQGEGVLSISSNEEKTEMLNVSDGHGCSHTEGTQASSGFIEAQTFSGFEINETAKSLGCKQVDLSSVLDGSVIKLSQLAEILRMLDEDELRFLFMSGGSSLEKFKDTDKMKVHDSVVHDAFERLKEQLYITSFSKDAFHLQLSEHQKFVDEICAVNASLIEVQEKNRVFAEEIEQCRYELQEVVSEREDLQKQLHFSNAQIEGLAAKVTELQNRLETAQEEISSLSSELVDCKNLVETLQAANENLNGSLNLMNEEKIKLSEENGIIVLENEKMRKELAESRASLESLQTLQRDERRRLEEENDSMVHQKCKLLADCADYKSVVESLEVENRNLNEVLTSVSEQRKKLEEEKVLLAHQIENRSKELMDCQDFVVTLQTEISNLSAHLMSITEERNKLEEAKQNIFTEHEEQSNELMQIKVLEASLQAECIKAVDELKGATLRVKQLTEENEALRADLEFHKSKIKEFDQRKCPSQFEEVANRGVENDISTLQRPKSYCSSLEQLSLDVDVESSAFVSLKRNLEDAEIVMQKLEKEIEGMHLHLTSFGRSTDKVAAPGVSKLIQAFESKGHADDQEPEKHPSCEDQTTEDPYMRTEKVAQNLRVLLKKLVDDVENASDFCRIQSKLLVDASGRDRSQYDSLREHTDQVEEANIELMVLYEVMKDHICRGVAREGELLILCDSLQKQELALRSENIQLREKLNEFQAKISELQSQLDGIRRDSDQAVASISNQVQILQAEVADRETILVEDWNSVSSQVLQTIGVLDSTIKTFYANSVAGEASNLDIVGQVAASVAGASKVIEDLKGQLEAAHKDNGEISDKNDLALSALNRLYNELNELLSRTFGYQPDETESAVVNDGVLNLLHNDVLNTRLDQLRKLFGERLELESENKQLNSELMSRAREIYELEKKCLKSDTVIKLVEEIEQSLTLEGTDRDADEPASHLESLIYLLVQKYKEAEQGLSLSTSLEMQLSDLRGQVEHLNFVLVQYENENLVFKHSLKSAEVDVISLNSKVQEKVAELEQSELRVSSLREKLSIAVTKGKGLISQRDSLRQSLAETSKELEKCSQELLSKDARLHELETKLKVYSEAGERMEALESELSYIRNSATALRESFLLKDSVLQRIEEILEDLDLPEHFHSRDIIEKIDWLAKSVGGNSLPPSDWDRRSSVGRGSYSDAGFLGGDGLTEDRQPTLNSDDYLRRIYEELQNKFYGLAEQNEMLEQSLMERNNLVQRWEEILDKVDMPSQLRSMEPEDKIQWMESALSETQNRCHSLQQKIDNLETLCGSLTANVEDSHTRTSELEMAFRQACLEREILSRDLEILSRDNDENSKKTTDFKIRIENLQNEVSMLQEQKVQMEEDIHHTTDAIRRLQELVNDALQDSRTEDVAFGQKDIRYFEEMLTKLIEKYKTLSSGEPVNIDALEVHVSEKGELSCTDSEEQNVDTLTKKLENSMGELMCLKEENDRYMLNNQSLLQKGEELEVKNKELQELLNQEEQKSASLREKLNVAVRKGKSLVQQRDGMKQGIEELNGEVEQLKSQIKHAKKAISEYEEKIKNLSGIQERVQVLESENIFLRDRLAETESCLQEKEGNWSNVLDALDDIDVGIAFNSGNPIEKLKEIGKHLRDLRSGISSLEQESRKSKRAAELLLAELNEVQERNDSLQEELAKAVDDLKELSRERDLAENAKYEALAHAEKLSHMHSEEKDRQLSEIMLLKSGVDDMREDLSAIDQELGDVLSKDLEIIHNVKAMMKSFFESGATPGLSTPFPGGVFSRKPEDKVFMTQVGSLREQLYNHSWLLQEEASQLSEVVMNVHKEYTSQKDSYEFVKRDVKKLELIMKERESELHILRGNISLLYETSASAISEIENWKDHAVGNNALAFGAPERNLIEGGNSFTNHIHTFSEEGIRGMRDKLSLAVRDFISMQSDLLEVGQQEMKNTILNLQKELQEKDVQRERICMELVNQIKEAETNAKNYLHDLEQVRVQLHASQRQLNVMQAERKVLEHRIKELQDKDSNSMDLQQKVNSLTDALTAKVQETEALMQALEEQEAEVEDLTNKIVGLENELQQKNKDLENLEASRAKAMKKLSVTVSKFDELHYLSESLLSEVEKLQSQLQERDGEISFLRQEVTRCTNDALAVTQMNKKRSSDEIHELLAWLDSLISPVYAQVVASDDSKNHLVDEYKEVLQNKILNLISDLENLRVVAQNSDKLLQEERSKVEELEQKEQYLKNYLREKESQLGILQGAGGSANATKSTSDIVEVEQMPNKWASTGNIAPQVRSLRKTNNDQVAIAIDVDQSSDRLEDDDDKAHGFKSLTTSRIVPRFTRPLSDMVDGLWVSCDRALMRQPALRLGVIIYWVVLHAMLATFVV